jgi:hypothetical protein
MVELSVGFIIHLQTLASAHSEQMWWLADSFVASETEASVRSRSYLEGRIPIIVYNDTTRHTLYSTF